jgi:hypothetical protein
MMRKIEGRCIDLKAKVWIELRKDCEHLVSRGVCDGEPEVNLYDTRLEGGAIQVRIDASALKRPELMLEAPLPHFPPTT